MHVVPLTLAEANCYVAAHHRHHQPCTIHRLSIGCVKDGRLVGVAIAGHPLARLIDQDRTLEVFRICTDGTFNACSFLYGAVRRVAFEMGFAKVITYTLPKEGGASLRGAGWIHEYTTDGATWSRPKLGRDRNDDTRPLGPKHRYAVINPNALPIGEPIDFGIPEQPTATAQTELAL